MATLEQLEEGIRRAHAAGNAEHVRALGQEYRKMQAAGSPATAPEGLVPGSPQYAQWAAEQARAGKKLPQVSQHTEFGNTGQEKFAAQRELIRQRYYPGLTDEQWQKSVAEPMTNLQPHNAGDLYAEGLRWNLGDEARGAAGAATNLFNDPGRAFQDYQRLEQTRRDAGREQSGLLGAGAELAGTVMSGGVAGGATRPATAVQAGVDAAKQGGAYGFLASEGDLVDRGFGATVGGATGGAIGSTVQKTTNALANRAATKAAVKGAPSAQSIKQGAQSAYRQMEGTGAVIQQPALNILKHDMTQAMKSEGLIRPSGKVDASFPRVAGALETIDDFASAPLGMKEAQTLHKSLQRAAGSTDPQEARIGMKMLDAFEDWMDSLPPSAVSGKADEAFNAWAKGKSDWARFKKVQTLETAIGKASRAKGGFNSGLKSQFNRILDNPKKQRGFTKAELKAMAEFAKDGNLDKLVNFFGGLKGLLSAAGVSIIPGGQPVAAAMVGGGMLGKAAMNSGAKNFANSMRANAAIPGGMPTIPSAQGNPITQDITRRTVRGGLGELMR